MLVHCLVHVGTLPATLLSALPGSCGCCCLTLQDLTDCCRAQKKLWVDKGKWGHDRFVDTFQAPKSTEEIIAEYGYDIRVYDTPPDAPPKSFGRGRYDTCHPRSPRRGQYDTCHPRSLRRGQYDTCHPRSLRRGQYDTCHPRSPRRGQYDTCHPRSPHRGQYDTCNPRSPRRGQYDTCNPRSPRRGQYDTCNPRSPHRGQYDNITIH